MGDSSVTRASSVRRPASLLALAVWPAFAACGGDAASRAAAGGDFCAEARSRVDAFMGGFEEPVGERYGGTAVVAGIGELADGMNALTSADYSALQHQLYVNLMPLIVYDSSIEPRPYLAESWEVSDDGTQLTFHLRNDVSWHDGEPTTAHDVAFTYRRATNPETGFANPGYWAYYDKSPDAVEVVDSFTVRVRLRPHADFMDPWTNMPIMPAHLLADVPAGELAQHPFGSVCPVGNGPFVFVEHRQDESWTFRRNPAFPEGLGGPPPLERYVYRVIVDETTILTDLLTESVDVYIGANFEHAERIQEAEHLELRAFPFRQYVFVGWNARRPQLADRRVRKALTLGTNRREMVSALLHGYGEVANHSVPSFHWAADTTLGSELEYDPERAKRLLEEAGWVDRDGDGVRENPDGLKLAVTIKYNDGNDTRRDIAQLMQAQLSRIGVAVQPSMVEWQTLLGQVIDPEVRDFDAVVFGWVTDFRKDDADLFHSRLIDGPYAISGTRNEQLDQLMDTLQLIVDRDEARPYWHEFQRVLVEEQPYTFIYWSQRLAGLNRRMRDVVTDVRGEWVNVREWWIPTDRRKYGSVADRP